MARLEDIIEVPGRYRSIALTEDKVVGSKVVFDPCNHKFQLDLLGANGNLEREFGKHASNEVPKYLFRDLNIFGNGRGTASPGNIFGGLLFWPLQALYNLVTLPLQKRYHKRMRDDPQILSYPYSLAASDDRIFVMDLAVEDLLAARYWQRDVSARLAIFDDDGKAIGKRLETGRGPGQLDVSYLMSELFADTYKESLVIVDSGGQRVQEFDLDGNFKRVIAKDIDIINMNSYCDMACNSKGIYVVAEAGSRGWDAVARIGWDGKVDLYNLGDQVRLAQGITASEDEVFVRYGKRVFTYSPDMELLNEDELDLPAELREGLVEDCMQYKDGMIYVPGCEAGVRTHHRDGSTTARKGRHVIYGISTQ